MADDPGIGARPELAAAVLARLRGYADAMADEVEALSALESPSRDPGSQEPVFARLAAALEPLDFRVRRLRGRTSGGQILARPHRRSRAAPVQIVMGHADTVWPVGTLGEMPLEREGDRLRGPGVYDMKAGLVQGIFALRVLRELGLEPGVTPVVFVNSDEEIGSPDSGARVARLARAADRVLVLEPSLGVEGRLKTTRRGVARYAVVVRGRAAHAGLDPEKGVSAIHELAHVVHKLHDLNDPARGIAVNVGEVAGGVRPNVVAPESRAVVDVRTATREDAAHVNAAIRGLRPELAGASLEIRQLSDKPPLEPTPGNRRLWTRAAALARSLGIPLDEGAAGGSSDGNTASLYAPTLDGLGGVGDGAHAPGEYVCLDRMPERAALLAALMLSPPLESGA